MKNITDLRISRNFKYTALYIAMGFSEIAEGIFEKHFGKDSIISVDSEKGTFRSSFAGKTISGKLNTHESFVYLECLNRVLEGKAPAEIEQVLLQDKKENLVFLQWDDSFPEGKGTACGLYYKSHLVSGVVEYEMRKVEFEGQTFPEEEQIEKDGFVIRGTRLLAYKGTEKKVVVPEGITVMKSCAFWDNLSIEEVVLPESLKNYGGDTFYYCKNLRSVNIPKNVEVMGNNPFAGCPLIEIKKDSPFFVLEGNALYQNDRIIWYSIRGSREEKEFQIRQGTRVIGKHCFYLCDGLEKITIPESVQIMENNPFSGCSKVSLDCRTKAYKVIDDVIYNGSGTTVCGTLNKIKNEHLVLPEGVKRISRNSFWNCKGIKKMEFPSSLEDIGYNPFVSCSNIEFISRTENYKVVDGILYNKDMSKLICCPVSKAAGKVYLPDSVVELERGAFSGCEGMTEIHLHNVNKINKSGFTNCSGLKKVYISDFISYVGEWAFSHCENLESVSVSKKTFIDRNAFSNSPVNLEVRPENENYLIESENLFTLKSLSKSYKGKVDSILIDPPYNSHIDYIGYKDGNYEDYHSFMKERIVLSEKILSDKGFLVVNIDEGEVKELADICKEVFGKENVSVHKWKKLHPAFDANKVIKNPDKVQTDFEYIIISRKEKAELKFLMQPYFQDGILKEKETAVPEIFDCFGTNSSAKDEIKEIFGDRDYFSTPKPVKLIKELIRATSEKDSVIMDFFAGSGTAGQACMELNREDGGNRKFILVTNDESDICCSVTKKRLDFSGEEFVFLK